MKAVLQSVLDKSRDDAEVFGILTLAVALSIVSPAEAAQLGHDNGIDFTNYG